MTNNLVFKDIMREVFNISLSKAADSLSFFVGKKIYINNLHLELIENVKKEDITANFSNAEAILETKIKGDYTGRTYLMFSEEDVKSFFKVAHPTNPNATINDEYSKELLLEADNIITASVISALADILKGFFYGDVPHFHSGKDNALIEQISTELEEATTLKIVAHFKSEGETVKPWFIWMIDKNFLDRLVEFASNEDELLKLKALIN